MTVYAITGKLGGGKSLYATYKIRAYVQQGRRVACNMDIRPHGWLKPWRDHQFFGFMRIPDRPVVRDLEAIGRGNDTTDETKNGLLVLDECATWLNTRSWQGSERQELIDWFVHARKKGWDVVFILQNVRMLDKQLRDGLIEMHTSVRRFDRYYVPGLTWLGIKLRLPRVHFAITKYGCEQNAVVADRDFFRGTDLFAAYDTQQIIEGGADNAVYSLLPPWQAKGRYMSKIRLFGFTIARAMVFGLVLGIGVGAYGYGAYSRDHARQAAVVAPAPVPIKVQNIMVGEIVTADGWFAITDDYKWHKLKQKRHNTGVPVYVTVDGQYLTKKRGR